MDTIHYFDGDRVECARTLALGRPQPLDILHPRLLMGLRRPSSPLMPSSPKFGAVHMAGLCRPAAEGKGRADPDRSHLLPDAACADAPLQTHRIRHHPGGCSSQDLRAPTSSAAHRPITLRCSITLEAHASQASCKTKLFGVADQSTWGPNTPAVSHMQPLKQRCGRVCCRRTRAGCCRRCRAP